MPHKFFLSHFSGDKVIAEIVAKLLHRLSLQQLLPWYSSDSSENGGLKPGNIWFNEILERISQSKAVITILTPNSIGRPWIYFESGIAQALDGCELVPVSMGIKRDEIAAPLGLYQCYQLTDYNSLKEFISKVLNKFDVVFDEELARHVLVTAIKELSKIEFDQKDRQAIKPLGFNEALTEIKNHIDKRFIDLLDQKTGNRKENSKSLKNTTNDAEDPIIYTAEIKINFPEFQGERFVEIRSQTSVQDVLDGLYISLTNYIQSYTYMQDWILVNPKNNQRMVLREIGKMIPAKYIFKPEIIWEAVKITSEYKAGSSSKIVRGNI